jgi:dynein heavy chain
VEKEKAEVETLAEEAQKDLEKAEPALRAAETGLE